MPAPLLLLAAACADWLIHFRSRQAIARDHQTDPAALAKAVSDLAPTCTYRGLLESALAQPVHRPDLIHRLTDLARQEEVLEHLTFQWRRAEETVAIVTNQEGGCKPIERLNAEKFANRLLQQVVRQNRDLQKARKDLEKAAADPAPTPNLLAVLSQAAPVPSSTPPAPLTPTFAEPSSSSPIPDSPSSESPAPSLEAPAAELPSPETPADSTEHPSKSSAPAAILYTPEEYTECLFKHRGRIATTPAKQRPALVQRLLAEYRARNKPTAA